MLRPMSVNIEFNWPKVTYKAHWGQVFGAAIGFYDADTFAADTDKIWVWTAYSF